MYRHDIDIEKYRALGRQPQFNCVGRISINGAQRGSCVLISDQYVLSAAHVVKSLMSETQQRNRVAAFTDVDILLGGKNYHPSEIVFYPSYDKVRNRFGDMVLIRLTTKVTDISPAIQNNDTNETGKFITCVGFGPARPANELQYDTSYGKIAGQNIVDSLSGERIKGLNSLLAFDFDNPQSDKMNRTGSAAACPLEYFPSGGDSGGGIFLENNGQWQLAGIVCGGIATASPNEGWYGSLGFASRVAAYRKWIEENIKRE